MNHAEPQASAIKVVYIAGYGRSGTTLLSIALGQHPRIFGAGEIHELTRHAWEQNTFCSCARALRDCPFWSDVVGRWLGSDEINLIDDYRRAQGRFESLGAPYLARIGIGGGSHFSRFAEQTGRLFHLIASASGKQVIVDSSKLPGRAWALAQTGLFEVYVVHMVRDGRGVAWSMMKGYKRDARAGLQREIKPKSALRTGLRWTMVNLAAEDLRRMVGADRYMRVRYEDFATDPAQVIARIGDRIGVDLSAVGKGVAAGEAMAPHHQIAGNRLRMNPTVKVAIDESWRSQMPESSRRRFGRLCGWLLRRYDYDHA
ncbi:MAG: sulfotransferase [Amphiplicatus sp.]|jgi:hypothetical protein